MRARPLTVAVVTGVVGLLLSAVWAIASPIGAGPDEPAHIIKAAAVARGQLVGTGIGGGRVEIPEYLVATQARTCFAFRADATADCARLADHGGTNDATGNTTAGLYNPLYYSLVGLPSLVLSGDTAIYAMRAMSALLTWFFAGLAAYALTLLRRNSWATIGGLAAATPALVFLGGMVNPNALEVTTTLAAFAGMLVLVTGTGVLVRTGATIAAAAAAVAVNVRGLSPLWVLVALAVPLLLADGATFRLLIRRPAVIVAGAAVALATAIAVTWTVGTASLVAGLVSAAGAPVYPGTGSHPLRGFVDVLLNTFTYGTQMVGTVGWLDTPPHGAVLFVWIGITAALLACVLLLVRGRQLAVALTLIGSFIVLPAVVQAIYVHDGGYIWQGRYALPLFACAVVGSAVMIGERVGDAYPVLARRAALLVLVSWSAAQLITLGTSVRRYAVGYDASWTSLLTHPKWQPDGGNLTWLALFAAVLAAVVLVAFSWSRTSSRALGTSD